MPLASTDRLPLTCTREGSCCHGHRIWITPWELQRIARGTGQTIAELRASATTADGRLLKFNGPANHRGKAGCAFYAAAGGCSIHPHRPLACRLFPLGRQRQDGAVVYHHVGERLPCYDQCPTVDQGPWLSVADYLATQDLPAAEAATDAYANVAYGLAATAAQVARLANIDVAALRRLCLAASQRPMEAWSHPLPEPWLTLAIDPPIDAPFTDPAAWAAAHGKLLVETVQHQVVGQDLPLGVAAELDLRLALHLAPAVGASPEAMGAMFG